MTEKEFILSALQHVWPDAVVPELMTEINERLDKFLDYHHNTYFEIEFVSKQDLEDHIKEMTPIEKASLF